MTSDPHSALLQKVKLAETALKATADSPGKAVQLRELMVMRVRIQGMADEHRARLAMVEARNERASTRLDAAEALLSQYQGLAVETKRRSRKGSKDDDAYASTRSGSDSLDGVSLDSSGQSAQDDVSRASTEEIEEPGTPEWWAMSPEPMWATPLELPAVVPRIEALNAVGLPVTVTVAARTIQTPSPRWASLELPCRLPCPVGQRGMHSSGPVALPAADAFSPLSAWIGAC